MFKFKLYFHRQSVGQSVSSSWCQAPWPDLNFLCVIITFFILHVRRPLWRENRSVICSAITHWLGSHRTRNHILLSHLRLPQTGGPGPLTHIPHTSFRFRFRLFCDQQSVCLGVGSPYGVHDQISITVIHLRSSCCGLPSLTRGWVCNLLVQFAVTLQSKSHITQDHILLSHLRLQKPGGPGPCIYIPQEQGGPVIPPGTGFPFCHLLRLTGLWWRYSNQKLKLYYDQQSVGQSVLVSGTHLGPATNCQIFFFLQLRVCWCGAP
jgi:hypothetical protein